MKEKRTIQPSGSASSCACKRFFNSKLNTQNSELILTSQPLVHSTNQLLVHSTIQLLVQSTKSQHSAT
jgi:hypothetical protein